MELAWEFAGRGRSHAEIEDTYSAQEGGPAAAPRTGRTTAHPRDALRTKNQPLAAQAGLPDTMSAQHQRQPRRKSLEALRRILRRPHRFSRNKVLPAAAPSPKGEESKELGGTGDISGAVNILLGDSGAAVAPAPAEGGRLSSYCR